MTRVTLHVTAHATLYVTPHVTLRATLHVTLRVNPHVARYVTLCGALFRRDEIEAMN